jgi:hypothetical protein
MAIVDHASEVRDAIPWQFRCTECGYGVTRRVAPERCPMCAATTWDYVRQQRPFALDADEPLTRELGIFPGVPFS